MSGGRKGKQRGLGLAEHLFPLMMLGEWCDTPLTPWELDTLRGRTRHIKNISIFFISGLHFERRQKEVFRGKEEVWWGGSILFVGDAYTLLLVNAYTSNLKLPVGLVWSYDEV